MQDENKPQGAQLSEEETKTLTDLGFGSIAELLEDRKKIADEKDKLSKMNEDAQKMIQRQGNELGDLRKKVTEVEEPTKPGDKVVEPEPVKKKEETLESVKKSLTKEQKELADEKFKQLSDDDRAAIAGDDKLAMEFLLQAQEAKKAIPQSLFEEKPKDQDDGDSLKKRVRDLFKNEKDQNSFVPSGPNRSPANPSSQPGSNSDKPRQPIRGGVLSAIKAEEGNK